MGGRLRIAGFARKARRLLACSFVSGLSWLLVPMPMAAEDADSVAGACINGSEWFRLRDVYEADSGRMSPFIRRLSKTMLDQFFRRPAAANAGILQLLRLHQAEMDGSLVRSMVMLLAQNYSDMDDNQQAAGTMASFIRQIEGHADSAAVAAFRNRESLYRALDGYAVCQNPHPRAAYRAAFRVREVGDSAQNLIYVGGRLNGRRGDFTLDTGAAYNVITPDLAKKHGLRIVGSGMQAHGMRALNGQYAIAERLQLGELELRNVPFVVLDHQQENRHAARAMRHFRLIIGQPLLLRFASWTLDFGQKELTFRTDTMPAAGGKSNLCMTGGGVMMVNAESGDHSYALNLDCGATTSWMGPAYYRDHSADVARLGRWAVKAGSGYGGIVYSSEFTMPEIALRIGGRDFTLKQVPVVTLSSEKTTLYDGAGRLGFDFFSMWRRLTVDNAHMVIQME
ncbi:MAG: retropepsin-like domain-containing protein [Prevotella sp.]|nr:retropepsin-like domain-containing protein [Prevotella sp.]